MEVEVEVLDVSEEEARTLLLSIDPLAALAVIDEPIHARLVEVAPSDSEALQALWRAGEEATEQVRASLETHPATALGEQFLVLVECRDEVQQRELLERFQSEGLACRALLS